MSLKILDYCNLGDSARSWCNQFTVSDVKALTVHRGPVCEKPTLNETRPPAAIAKCLVVFRVMNAELNNMRCRHATSTADMPPDGFSIRRLLVHRTVRARPSRAPAFTPTFYRS